MSQVPELTPEQALKLDQLQAACKAVYREITKLQIDLRASGIQFPAALTILLDQQRDNLDSIYLILNPVHLKADAKNPG